MPRNTRKTQKTCCFVEEGYIFGKFTPNSEQSILSFVATSIMITLMLFGLCVMIVTYDPDNVDKKGPLYIWGIRIIHFFILIFNSAFICRNGKKSERPIFRARLLINTYAICEQIAYFLGYIYEFKWGILLPILFFGFSLICCAKSKDTDNLIILILFSEIQNALIFFRLLGVITNWPLALTPIIVFHCLVGLVLFSAIKGAKLKELYFIGFGMLFVLVNLISLLLLDNFNKEGSYRYVVLLGPLCTIVVFWASRFFLVKIIIKKRKLGLILPSDRITIQNEHREVIRRLQRSGTIKKNKKRKKRKRKTWMMDLGRLRVFTTKNLDGKFGLKGGEQDSECQICFINAPDTVYDPCSHYGVCKGCSTAILKSNKTCPFCRADILALIFYRYSDDGKYQSVGYQHVDKISGAGDNDGDGDDDGTGVGVSYE